MVVVSSTTSLHIKQDYNYRFNGDNDIFKRNEISDECQYINSLFGKDNSYNCCEKEGITCSDGHIIKM